MTPLKIALATISIGLSICLTVGCGAPASKVAPVRAVPLCRFDVNQAVAAPTAATWAAHWVGEYDGTAEVSPPGEDGQTASQPIRLLVQAAAPGRLTVLQLPAGHPGSFMFDVEVDNPGRIAGQQEDPDAGLRWEYSFSRSGVALTGTIRVYRKDEGRDRFEPGDEWVLTATRTTGP